MPQNGGVLHFWKLPQIHDFVVEPVSLASVARPAWKSNVMPAWNFKDKQKRLTRERPADLFWKSVLFFSFTRRFSDLQ